jgi:hypothetical protein
MKFFIQMNNGVPHEHPIFEQNFLEAFPDIDPENLPENFAKFERKEVPADLIPTPYQRLVVDYVYGDDGIVRDVWRAEDVSPEERDEIFSSKLNEVLGNIEFAKQMAQQELDAAENDESKEVWVRHIQDLNAIVVGDDPFSFVMPQYPFQDAAGNWVTIYNAGSAPNVIE